MGHVLRRRVRHGSLTSFDGAAAIRDLRLAPIERFLQDRLLERAWELRANVSFYDALYVALAERLEQPLLTFDRRLAGVPGVRCDVVVL